MNDSLESRMRRKVQVRFGGGPLKKDCSQGQHLVGGLPYGDEVRRCLESLHIEEVVTAPRSPWQNPYVERLIGSIRRELLDHVIVLNAKHLRQLLAAYLEYYHQARPHMGLGHNAPQPRAVEPPEHGRVIAEPMVGGLHHRYRRCA
jgi:putative transposase